MGDVEGGFYWWHAERSSAPAICQRIGATWYLIGEKASVSTAELHRRGWELLGPVTGRPFSKYLDT